MVVSAGILCNQSFEKNMNNRPGTRNIWIFGGTGFIGSALVKHLSRDKSNLLHLLIHKKAEYVAVEHLNTLNGSLADFDPFWFKRYPPDILFHLARPAGSNVVTRNLRAPEGERANRRLVRILKSLKKPPLIVYVSGSLMYGERSVDNPAIEDSPMAPGSFARYYIRNELPWLEEQLNGRLDVRFARPGWIVGPGSWFREFFWKPFVQSGKVPCYGDGGHTMSVIHIGDCAAMIDALGRYGTEGINLNIFSGNPIPHRDFCEILAKLLNTETEIIPYESIRRKYGKVTAEALISSGPMQTLYPEIHQKAEIQFHDAEAILADVIRLLKNV